MENITVGKYCRDFRINELEMTLREVEGNKNIKTLSSFEHGYSTNMNHLYKYISKCIDKEQQILFFEGLLQIINEVK